MIKDYFAITKVIPFKFYMTYFNSLGSNRKYRLESYMFALLIQKLFSITTTDTLILVLRLSKELINFCGFNNGVPDKFTF